jgi:DNA invertase Pin-like site-specific DNA recombinase
MIAAVYARKSDDNSDGVERQTEIATDFIVAKGWSVGPTFADNAVSGGTFDRPGLNALLSATAQTPRPFDAIVMMDASRLGREQSETLSLQVRLTKAGYRIFHYQDNIELKVGTATEKLMAQIPNFGHEHFKEQIALKTAAALRKKAQQGHVAGGRLYGYRNVPTNGHSERVRDDAESAVVRDIFKWYVEGISEREIAERLNKRGVAAPRAPKAWAVTSLRAMLQNERYRGVMIYDDIRIENAALEIVPADLWNAARAKRESRRMATTRLPAGSGVDAKGRSRGGRLLGKVSRADQGSEHLLPGFMVCGLCGGNVWLVARQRKTKARQWLQRWYECSTAHTRGSCENGAKVGQAAMERAVFGAIKDAMVPGAALDAAIDQMLEAHKERWATRGARRTALEGELGETVKRIERLVTAVTSGGDIEPLVAALKAEKARQDIIEAEMADLSGAAVGAVLPTLLSVDGPGSQVLPAWGEQEQHLRQSVTDALTVLSASPHVGPRRTLLRRLLGAERFKVWPTQDGRGLRFEATLGIGAILGTVGERRRTDEARTG